MGNSDRWGLIESSIIDPADQLSLADLVLWPSVLYLAWQAAFLLATEILFYFGTIYIDTQLLGKFRNLFK